MILPLRGKFSLDKTTCAKLVYSFGNVSVRIVSVGRHHSPPTLDRIWIACTSFIPILLLMIISSALSQTLSSRIANYKMIVRLNPSTHSIDGRETLTWHNESDKSVGELYFHLYNNAYKSDRTTFMRERTQTIAPWERGWIDILRIMNLKVQSDLTSAIKYAQPDDDNPHDSTVIVVGLDKPIAPHDSAELMIDFREHLPQAIWRSGWSPEREFYFVSQWFPKIGVFENGRWICHQCHGFTGFFADFGVYDVQINVPLQYTVGASGVRVGEDMNPDGSMTYHYVAQDVHDFAWTASPHFLTRTAVFPDSSPDGYPEPRETKITLLLQPEHSGQEDRYFAAVDTAIKYFGSWYGPYPYPEITIVDPPRNTGVGGMEYPMLITAGTADYTLKDFLSPEAATIHEFGHQYWYGMVANDEVEEAWLDGGLDSYSTGTILEQAYGANTSVFRIAGVYPVYLYPIWSIGGVPVAAIIGRVWIHDPYNRLPLYLKYAKTDAVSEIGYEASDRGVYRTIAYDKPELVLRTLEGLIGSDIMQKTMRTYFEEYKFKHPTAGDFEKVCEQVSGKNLDWFFSEFIHGTDVVDFAVSSIDYYEETNLNTGTSSYVTKVVVARHGEVKMTVDLRLATEDGGAIDTVWDGQDRSRTFEFRTSSPPTYAVLDPWNKIPIDINYSDNSLLVNDFFLPVVKWAHRILNYFQNMLLNVGVIV